MSLVFDPDRFKGSSSLTSQNNPSMERIKKLYDVLKLELKSTKQRRDDVGCGCLVNFQNCTPHGVVPFWIDFQGRAVDYRYIPPGQALQINTYRSHLWFFQAIDPTSGERWVEFGIKPDVTPLKVLAIPQEILQSICNSPKSLSSILPSKQLEDSLDETSISNTVPVCPMCKYIVEHQSKDDKKVRGRLLDCGHLKGSSRFSILDLDCVSKSKCKPSYIYSCSEETHREDHSQFRRDIYLVEPFLSLRERCFYALDEMFHNSDIVNISLPVSLQKEYLQFISTLEKTYII